MNWAEAVKAASDFVIPVFAVIGSLLGILVALDQITAGSRLRRQALFWREMVQNAAVSQDAAVFQSLEREASARLIALQALPARKLLLPSFNVTTAVALAVSLGIAIGEVPATELTWDTALEKTSQQGAEFFLWLLIPFLIARGVFDFVNLLLDRAQIAKAYLEGRSVQVRRPRLDDRSPADAFGWSGFFQVMALSLGLALAASGIGGYAAGMSHDVDARSQWLFLLVLAGIPLSGWGALLLFARVQDATSREWQHPRPLPHQPRRHWNAPGSGSSRTAQRWGRARR